MAGGGGSSECSGGSPCPDGAALGAESGRLRRIEAIRAAAARLFSERGYDRTALEDIAADAGLPVQMVTNYAGGKAELFIGYYRERRRAFLSRLASAGEAVEIASHGASTQVEQGVDHFVEFVEENRDAWLVMRRRGSAGEAPFAGELHHGRAELGRLLSQLLAEGRAAAGNSSIVSTELAAHGIIGAVEAAATWWLENGEVPREALVRQLAELLWAGLERQIEG